MKILVTGAAGFIGFHLVEALLSDNHEVCGLDNINNYYDPSLKKLRLNNIENHVKSSNFKFIKADISDREIMKKLFDENSFEIVVNLAAQAGVRYSIENPDAYVDSNLIGFANILEGCRKIKIKHLIYASSSSVYGMNNLQPFNTNDKTDYPISFYAATKKSNEVMAHAYSHLYNIPTTGLRFFTVYGPYGRPDMAYFKFTNAITNGEPIEIYNNGLMERDFTYIDDVILGIIALINKTPKPSNNNISASKAPHKIYNIGNNNPITLRRFINAIESAVGKKAIEKLLPMQQGDVPLTYADIEELYNDINFRPTTKIEEGIFEFVKWYKELDRNYLRKIY